MHTFQSGQLQCGGSFQLILNRYGAAAEAAAPDPIPIELDGDEFGEAVRITCRADPGALLLALPYGHPVHIL